MNTNTTKVGRPLANVQYPRGIFTVDSLYELNRGPRGKGKRTKVCKLTVRKHIDAAISTGTITKVGSVKTGKPGKPAIQFVRADVVNKLVEAQLDRQAVAETPVSVETQTPVAELVSNPS